MATVFIIIKHVNCRKATNATSVMARVLDSDRKPPTYLYRCDTCGGEAEITIVATETTDKGVN